MHVFDILICCIDILCALIDVLKLIACRVDAYLERPGRAYFQVVWRLSDFNVQFSSVCIDLRADFCPMHV